MRDDQGRQAGPLIGLLVVAAALVPYFAASHVIDSDDSDFGAPRWVVAWLVVVCFFFPGLAILGTGSPRSRAGLAGRWLAALLPSALAPHSLLHAFTRAGGVQLAWIALAALVAYVALVCWRRLIGTFAELRGPSRSGGHDRS